MPRVTEDKVSTYQDGDVCRRNRYGFYDQELSCSHMKSDMSVRYLSGDIKSKFVSEFGVHGKGLGSCIPLGYLILYIVFNAWKVYDMTYKLEKSNN